MRNSEDAAAAPLLTQECESGSGKACYVLGSLYRMGLLGSGAGYSQYARSRRKQACEMGYERACRSGWYKVW